MLKNIAIVLLVVACIIMGWVISTGNGTGGAETITVIAARADIPKGTPLSADMLETRTLPRYAVQRLAFEVGSMTDINAPVGQAAAVDIPKGDQLTANCLLPAGGKPAAGADRKLLSQERYIEGLKYFQNSNYARARAEWQEALKLNPVNADARAGLKRIDQIESGGK